MSIADSARWVPETFEYYFWHFLGYCIINETIVGTLDWHGSNKMNSQWPMPEYFRYFQ